MEDRYLTDLHGGVDWINPLPANVENMVISE